jgi:Protein of unknown function (DUF2911)
MMRKNRFLRLALVPLLLATASAQTRQQPVQVFGGQPDERASTRILYETDKAVGEFAIDYGRPAWKKEYDDPATFDKMTRGKVWRLGKDFWTTLDTNLQLRIAGKEILAGYYYLGLQRSEDGDTWSLAFLDPVKIRSSKLDAFEIHRAPIELMIPLKLEQSQDRVDRLTLLLSPQKESVSRITLTIAWGKLQLTAPIEVQLKP